MTEITPEMRLRAAMQGISPLDRLQEAVSEFIQDQDIHGEAAMAEDKVLFYGIAAIADELRTANLIAVASSTHFGEGTRARAGRKALVRLGLTS